MNDCYEFINLIPKALYNMKKIIIFNSMGGDGGKMNIWLLQITNSFFSCIWPKIVAFAACDEELFEDSPDQWVSQELEGADSETRRRAAVDFVRVLSRHFEARMTQVFGQYVQVT